MISNLTMSNPSRMLPNVFFLCWILMLAASFSGCSESEKSDNQAELLRQYHAFSEQERVAFLKSSMESTNLGQSQKIALLGAAVKDSSEMVTQPALEYLRKTPSKQSAECLKGVLGSSKASMSLKASAAIALDNYGKLGNVCQASIIALLEQSYAQRYAPTDVDSTLYSMSVSDPRCSFYRALGSIGDGKAIPVICRLLKKEYDVDVVLVATHSISVLLDRGTEEERKDAVTTVRDSLLQCVENEDLPEVAHIQLKAFLEKLKARKDPVRE